MSIQVQDVCSGLILGTVSQSFSPLGEVERAERSLRAAVAYQSKRSTKKKKGLSRVKSEMMTVKRREKVEKQVRGGLEG